MSSSADCLFCKILAGELPADVVYEDERVLAFRDISPQAPTHVLVIPRQHIDHAGVVGVDDAETVVAMLLGAQEVAQLEGIDGPDRGFRLIMNVGPDGQNSVPHLHLHVLGGRSMTWPPG
jgi:histidine triad (HIT) family protein